MKRNTILMPISVEFSKLIPCKDCTDRHVNCHSECDKYKKYRKLIDEKQKLALKDIKAKEDLYDFKGKTVARERHRRRTRSRKL